MSAAVARTVDANAGKLMKLLLELVNSEWSGSISCPFYYTDVSVAIKKKEDCEALRSFGDQYLKILTEDGLFVRRVGDEGGGAYVVDFDSAATALAAATIESVVLEKFGSKALRIFRYSMQRTCTLYLISCT